jgi:hypothetical protein
MRETINIALDKFGYTYVFAGDPDGYGATCHEFGMHVTAGQFKAGAVDGLAVREMTDTISAGEFCKGERDGRIILTEFMFSMKTFQLCHRGRETSTVPFDARQAEHAEVELSAMNARVRCVELPPALPPARGSDGLPAGYPAACLSLPLYLSLSLSCVRVYVCARACLVGCHVRLCLCLYVCLCLCLYVRVRV